MVTWTCSSVDTCGSISGTCPGPAVPATVSIGGSRCSCGPRGLDGESDLLFRNAGDGRFEDVSDRAGVSDPKGHRGLGVAWFDYDRDGWIDLYVANDAGPSLLYHNEKDGTFKEVGFAAGVAVSEDGSEQGGMGVAVGDYDNSGRPSLFKTNFADESNNLYRNDGAQFTDVSFQSRTAPPSVPLVGWGAAFFDYDNDGFLDLVAVNGHVYPQLEKPPPGASGYRQRALLYRNKRDGTFEEVAAAAGPALTTPRASRGLAAGDLDNDGRLDLVINDVDGGPQVLRNEVGEVGNWLLVRLAGAGQNTSAIGAVVTVRAGALSLTRVVQSGTSYLSQDDQRQHFGIGKAVEAESVEVRWPDGTTSRKERVKANQVLVIEQSR